MRATAPEGPPAAPVEALSRRTAHALQLQHMRRPPRGSHSVKGTVPHPRTHPPSPRAVPCSACGSARAPSPTPRQRRRPEPRLRRLRRAPSALERRLSRPATRAERGELRLRRLLASVAAPLTSQRPSRPVRAAGARRRRMRAGTRSPPSARLEQAHARGGSAPGPVWPHGALARSRTSERCADSALSVRNMAASSMSMPSSSDSDSEPGHSRRFRRHCSEHPRCLASAPPRHPPRRRRPPRHRPHRFPRRFSYHRRNRPRRSPRRRHRHPQRWQCLIRWSQRAQCPRGRFE